VRLVLAPLVNLLKLLWAALFLPLRLLTAGRRPAWVRFRLSGELPFRRSPRRGLRFWRKVDPAAVPSVEHLRRQLRRLAGDPALRGVVFEVDGLEVTAARREALVALFDDLRRAGKEVVGFGMTVSNAEYELLCRADRVILPAAGRVDLVGFAAELSAIGQGLSHLGVTAHFIRRGDYKTAPELFTRSDISEIQRRTVEALLDERYERLVSAIGAGRKLPADDVRARIDQGPYSARRALGAGLVDALGSEADLPRLLARPDDKPRKEGGAPEVAVGTFEAWEAGRRLPTVHWRPVRRRAVVGVVSVSGMIAEGKGGTLPAGPVVAGSVTVISALEAAGKNPRVPAVVLYVSSPGGSAPASELILDAVKRLSEKKPVVAYFDRVAASGGYMALCGAKEIWAGPGALVGSIGVFGGKFDLSGLFGRLGVHRTLITRGQNAGYTSPSRGFTDPERASMEREIEETYQSFLEIVAAARGRTREEIHQRGEGRVFTSARALEEGLVDRVGGFEDACRRALELAGKPVPVELDVALFGARPPRSGLLSLLGQLRGTHLFALDDRLVGSGGL
jgi:protease-4